MVVTRLAIAPFTLELASPLGSASGTIATRRGWVVRYGDGIGEATPLPPWTEPPEATAAALEALDGTTPHIGQILADLASLPAARHGVALAAADHQAKRRNEPLHRTFGAERAPPTISVNATIDAETPAAVAADARSARRDGYSAIKLKVDGADPTLAIARVQAAREALDSELGLRLDANASWDGDTLRSVGPLLRAAAPAYLEQPTPGIDASLIRDLAHAGLPVALDEAVTAEGVLAAVRTDASVLVVKPMALGGPDRALAAAKTARSCGLVPVISDLMTAAVARTGAAHLAACLDPTMAAGLDTGRRLASDLVESPPAVVGGELAVPSGPGLGLGEVRVPNGS